MKMKRELVNQNGLNPIQVSLLRYFNRQISDNEVVDLKRTLVRYYSKKLKTEINKVVIEKNYTQIDFDKMLEIN